MARPRHTPFAGRRARDFRNELTISEARLWSVIRRGRTGARFRRQVPIGRWIADFASLEPKIVIEVDDESHHWRDETERSRYIADQGFTILRIDNADVAGDVAAIADWIAHTVAHLKSET